MGVVKIIATRPKSALFTTSTGPASTAFVQLQQEMPERTKLFLVTTLLLTTYSHRTESLNVLMLATVESVSHYTFCNAITTLLLERRHHVYELTTRHPASLHPNRTSFVADIKQSNVFVTVTPLELKKRSTGEALKYTADWSVHSCKNILNTKAARDLLAFARDKMNRPHIDVVVHDYVTQQCIGAFASEFGNAPVIAVTAYGNALELDEVLGGPVFPGFVPHDMVIHPYTDKPMGFFKRLENKWAYLVSHVTRYHLQYPQMDAISKMFFGAHTPTIEEHRKKVALVLTSSHPVIQGARPQLPASIPIGGVHIAPAKILPNGTLKDFLDGAKDGFILMSLGSLVPVSQMEPWQRDGLFRAFEKLSPLRILLKWESDWDTNQYGPLPDNVFVRKWIPQNDVQAHPNIRLFVTHCGGHTTTEVIARAVPVVAVPIMYDQHVNAHRLAALNAGVVLPFEELNEETFYKSVRTVLDDKQYALSMRQLSALYYEQPETPQDRTVFWVEFVARHKGAAHLRSSGEHQAWVTRWMIDDVIVITLIIIIIGSATKKLCSALGSRTKAVRRGRSKRD